MKFLVTGGTNGMGKGVVKALANYDNQSHEIIILCRSKELGKSTIKEIESTTNNKKTSIVLCDLSKISDTRKAIDEIHDKHEYLDGIFINAGLGYASKQIITEDGMESHFQVNYLSQFMLTLNLLALLEKSKHTGRVVFNITKTGEIFWNDIQMKENWHFEKGIHQAMAAKKLFYNYMHNLYNKNTKSKISFYGFEIHKTVWSNQINIIPFFMKSMAKIMQLLGRFISIDECGTVISPLFIEKGDISFKKSGKFITYKNNNFVEFKDDKTDLNNEFQKKLWKISLDLCKDKKTSEIAEKLTKE
jgi:hypothetical protein